MLITLTVYIALNCERQSLCVCVCVLYSVYQFVVTLSSSESLGVAELNNPICGFYTLVLVSDSLNGYQNCH